MAFGIGNGWRMELVQIHVCMGDVFFAGRKMDVGVYEG